MEGDINSYVADYKRELLEALVREGVNDWAQVEKGMAAITSDFLPNPNRFARDCKGGGEITGAWGTGAHKIYRPDRLLVDQDAKDRAEESGRSEIDKLKGMFA